MPPYPKVKFMEALRLELPHTRRVITRLIYYCRLDENSTNKHFKCCTKTKHIEWMSIETVAGNLSNAWGPELAKFTKLALGPIEETFSEYTLEEALKYVPREPPRNAEETLLCSIKVTEKDVERLYISFLDHCFPSVSACPAAFKHYLKKYAFEKDEHCLEQLFKTFDQHKKGKLSFHEFLIGLTLMEPSCTHGELRAAFIFRFYDVDGDGALNMEELGKMLTDMHPKKGVQEIAKLLTSALENFPSKSVNERVLVNLQDFCDVVGRHKFRGTSRLCRASKPIFAQITQATAERTVMSREPASSKGIVRDRSYKGNCMGCLSNPPTLAAHMVDLSHTGCFLKARHIFNYPYNKRSIEVTFNEKHPANILIEKIRLFNEHKGTNLEPNGLMTENPQELLRLTEQLCHEVGLLFKKERKCQPVAGPCYVISGILITSHNYAHTRFNLKTLHHLNL